jgi:hypothetical protein
MSSFGERVVRHATRVWAGRPMHLAQRPLKGLTDNPAYQWWRDPTIMQPDSWWGAAQDTETLGARVQLMRELGVRIFRVELPWRAISAERPGGDQYDATSARNPDWPGYRWERFDLIVRLASAAGIILVPQVVFAPEWSTGLSAARGGAAAPPGAAAHFADVMAALARRYRRQVHYWELWNEPDHPHSWSGTLAQYVNLILRPGATALRKADPECRILLGGLAYYGHLAEICEAGGGPFFDIANIHIYPERPTAGPVRTAVRHVRAILRAGGNAGRPIWVTECGIASRPPSTPSGFGGVTDEAGQARFLRALYHTVDVQAICYYQLGDTAIFDAAGTLLKQVYWGLVTRDLQRRKSAFRAYQHAVPTRQDVASRP